MREYGGFEGNAQTLRIVSRLEKKIVGEDSCYGLNLTFRSLASILKYDNEIPERRKEKSKLVKGYYSSEGPLVTKIKEAVLRDSNNPTNFKTIECSIMDLSDDIAYSTYDLEDSFKAGFLTPADMLSSGDELLDEVATKVKKELGYEFGKLDVLKRLVEIFKGIDGPDSEELSMVKFINMYRASKALASNSNFRTRFSSLLVGNAIKSVNVKVNNVCLALSKVHLSSEVKERVEVLKQFTYVSTIYSSKVKLSEYRGYEVVEGIFTALAGKRGDLLMPEDIRSLLVKDLPESKRMRIICDFIAGMTDRYAMEFYGRLHSDSAQSMFKPI